MPTYLITDNSTGKKYNITGDSPPSDAELEQIFGSVQEAPTQEKSIGRFAENVIKDVPEVAKNIWGALKGVAGVIPNYISGEESPTATAIAGGISKIFPDKFKKPGFEQPEQMFTQAKTAIAEDFSKYKKPLDYAYSKPASAAMDLSTLLTGLGGATKMAGATNVGSKISKLGSAIEPINAVSKIATKGIPLVAKGISKTTNSILGTITGKGTASFEQIGQPGFFKSLWGKTTGEELIRKAETGLSQAVAAGKGEYRAGLEKLKLSRSMPDFTPITAKAQTMLDSFEVNHRFEGFNRLIADSYKGKMAKQSRAADIDAVFGMSTLDEAAIPDVLKALRVVKKWGESSDNLSARGLDILKRKLGNMVSDTDNGGSFIKSLAGETRDTLIAQYPEYAKTMKSYRDILDMQTDVSNALGIKDPIQKKANVDLALRKMLTTMREDNEFRRSVLDSISRGAAKTLPAELAGYNLRPLMPGGLFGRNLEAGFILGGIFTKDPALFAGMMAASPKVSATVLSGIKEMAKASGKLKIPLEWQQGISPAFKQLPFQIGNMQRAIEQPQQNTQEPLPNRLKNSLSETKRVYP